MPVDVVVVIILKYLLIAHYRQLYFQDRLLSGGKFVINKVLNFLMPSESSDKVHESSLANPSSPRASAIRLVLDTLTRSANLRTSRRRYANAPHVIQRTVIVQVMVTHHMKTA